MLIEPRSREIQDEVALQYAKELGYSEELTSIQTRQIEEGFATGPDGEFILEEGKKVPLIKIEQYEVKTPNTQTVKQFLEEKVNLFLEEQYKAIALQIFRKQKQIEEDNLLNQLNSAMSHA